MMLTHWKIVAALALAAALLAGTGGYVYETAAAEPGPAPKTVASADKPATADNPKADKDAIQGTWQVTVEEVGGKDVSKTEGELKDLANAKWVFTADKITFLVPGKGDHSAAYKIDSSKKPKELDVTPHDGPPNEKDKAIPAIYGLEGDVLKICVGSPQDSARPTELASKEGSKDLLITFKREKAGKEKPEAKPGGDKEAIQGVWQITDFAVKGKGPDEVALAKIKGAKWVFTADKVVVQTPGEKDAPASYTLDSSQTPKELDFTPQGGPAQQAIYSLDGDVLKICAPGPEGGPRPTEFAAKEGGKALLITFKRVEAAKDKPKDDK